MRARLWTYTGPPPSARACISGAYDTTRLPSVRRLVLGQSLRQFAAAGMPVDKWQVVRTRGRRRPLRWDGAGTLAVFVAMALWPHAFAGLALGFAAACLLTTALRWRQGWQAFADPTD